MKPLTKRLLAGGIFVLAVLLSEPIYWQLSDVPAGAELETQQTNIYAAVFSNLTDTTRRYLNSPWSGYCIEVLNKDPEPMLLQKLSLMPAPTKPSSSCFVNSSHESSTVDVRIHDKFFSGLHLPNNYILHRITSPPKLLNGGLVIVEAADYLDGGAGTGSVSPSLESGGNGGWYERQ